MPTHEYPVTVSWTGGREGSGKVVSHHSDTQIAVAVPPEFQGPGGGASPEELLTSAIAACYTMTFGIIAANRKIPLKSVRAEAVGSVEQAGAQFTYTAAVIRPTIVLDAAATDDQIALATDMAHKADAYCIITNAIRGKVAITVEPKIERG
ncbi:MAG: OsmC family protein [Fimbriimonas ginsengisoli]|uniref:OsmC family protein n=1 Tax=Fimbriimonas ginsengisoli TaxID=1005039 RepID=A0A931LRB9_FIMGI|nr:OsmC family protein [Fimbriimonas ginsengisoli]